MKFIVLNVIHALLIKHCRELSCLPFALDDALPKHAFKLPTPVSLPTIVAIVAAPLTTTLQTAWLGLNGSVALAAFSAVNTSAVFAVKIFIFFTDGVAAKVGSWWPGAGMSW